MKIGLVLPWLLMAKRFEDRIFAPKELFLWLADGLVERGHEVYVYSANATDTKARLIPGNAQLEAKDYISIKDIKKKPEEIAALTFARAQSEYEIELTHRAVIHANKHNLDILHVYLDNFAHYFAQFCKSPVVFTLHDPVFKENILERLRLSLFPNFNYIMISDKQKTTYESSLHFTSTFTIHHGLEIRNFSYTENPQNYIAIMGRILPEKGFEDAIQIATQLNKKLKLATSKNYLETAYFNTLIKPLLHSPNIEQMLYLQENQKNEFLGLAKAFLFPIKWEEPFGMVMIEAMATGTPVVAYAQGSVPEILKDGETGFIVNLSEQDKRGDWIIKKTGTEGLSEAVERIYAMPQEQYHQMRKNCRLHIERHFTTEKMVNNYEKVYREIIDKQ